MLEKQQKPKTLPQLKIANDFLDLKTVKTNVIVEHLEEAIKLREMPLEHHIKKKFLR